MAVRIPRPVNRAIDWTSSHRVFAATTAAVTATAAIALRDPSTAALIPYGIACLLVGAGWRRQTTAEIRNERDQLDRDNARLTERLRHVTRGDANAPTQQLRAIGDHGEPL